MTFQPVARLCPLHSPLHNRIVDWDQQLDPKCFATVEQPMCERPETALTVYHLTEDLAVEGDQHGR